MALQQIILRMVERSEELKSAGAGGNEANTKALLIEPMLNALG